MRARVIYISAENTPHQRGHVVAWLTEQENKAPGAMESGANLDSCMACTDWIEFSDTLWHEMTVEGLVTIDRDGQPTRTIDVVRRKKHENKIEMMNFINNPPSVEETYNG
jgi:hypothetical protein